MNATSTGRSNHIGVGCMFRIGTEKKLDLFHQNLEILYEVILKVQCI